MALDSHGKNIQFSFIFDVNFQVKDIHLHAELFSVENGLLTPTFKAKRQDLKTKFSGQIETMYSKLT